MIHAKTAAHMSVEYCEPIDEKRNEIINTAIIDAAQKGLFACTLDIALTEHERHTLYLQGYKLETQLVGTSDGMGRQFKDRIAWERS